MTEAASEKKYNSKALRSFVTQPCQFILAAAEDSHFDSIEVTAPEVAFWGRSNVGKSSLINAVMERKGLARTSNTPGRTQQIIFFNLADELLLADLPGYGYAKASKKDIAKWNRLIRYYLQTRSQLRCVFLLIDGRHGLKTIDKEMMEFLDIMAVSYQIILTKADQIKPKKDGDPADRVVEIEKELKKHPAARPEVFLTSAAKGQGLDPIRQMMQDIALVG